MLVFFEGVWTFEQTSVLASSGLATSDYDVESQISSISTVTYIPTQKF